MQVDINFSDLEEQFAAQTQARAPQEGSQQATAAAVAAKSVLDVKRGRDVGVLMRGSKLEAGSITRALQATFQRRGVRVSASKEPAGLSEEDIKRLTNIYPSEHEQSLLRGLCALHLASHAHACRLDMECLCCRMLFFAVPSAGIALLHLCSVPCWRWVQLPMTAQHVYRTRKPCPEEAFLLSLMDCPMLHAQLQAAHCMHTVEAVSQRLEATIHSLGRACDDVQHSALLKAAMGATLQAGNFLNSGTQNAGAQAFDPRDLLKLRSVKATRGQAGCTTLLHFVANSIRAALVWPIQHSWGDECTSMFVE
jgi:Formin Homology 2 Domain